MRKNRKNVEIRDNGPEHAWAWVVGTDTVLSGWGGAPGRSLYALPVETPEEAEIVLTNMRHRTDMARPRLVRDARRVRLHDGDHMSIANREIASRWYQPGAWRD